MPPTFTVSLCKHLQYRWGYQVTAKDKEVFAASCIYRVQSFMVAINKVQLSIIHTQPLWPPQVV